LVKQAIKAIIVGASVIAATGTVLAQAGSEGPAPGTADSKAVVQQNRETNAEYNRQIGAKHRKPSPRIKAVSAVAADLVVGRFVHDKSGTQIGEIQGVEADGVIIASDTGKVKVPTEAFGKDKRGLLLQITKAEFDAAVASANAPGN
jgi:hypothetical protein